MCYSTVLFVFFNDTATTEIYTLSLHDALPIYNPREHRAYPRLTYPSISRSSSSCLTCMRSKVTASSSRAKPSPRSEEHTSELQSRQYLVCRLLLEKKNTRFDK